MINSLIKKLDTLEFKSTLILSCALVLITSFFSVGFYHPDEQFSIIELLNYKNGNVSWDIFNWDIHLKMRPFFQVFVLKGLYEGLSLVGIESPFIQSFFFRLFHISFGFYSFYLFSKSYFLEKYFFDKKVDFGPRALYLAVALTWFVPYVMVRTSSESLSISFFLLGLSFYNEETGKGWSLLFTGLLLGLSFCARFQMGIAAFSFFLWMLLVKKEKQWVYMALLCLGVVLSASSLLLFDWWGYGEFTLSPWNYLRENLIEGKVNNYGVKPFTYFFTKGLVKGGILPSGLLLFSTFLFFKEKRIWKTPWPWIVFPYFLVHCLVGHKEIRFINFLFVLTPLFFIHSYPQFKFRGEKAVTIMALVVNGVLLLKVLIAPAYKPLSLYKTIYDQYSDNKIYTIEEEGKAPLTLEMRFYTKNEQKLIPKRYEELLEMDNFLLLTSRFDERKGLSKLNCTEVDSIYPNWIYHLNYFNWLGRSSVWSLWKCDKRSFKLNSSHF